MPLFDELGWHPVSGNFIINVRFVFLSDMKSSNLGVWALFCLGFMYCIILALRALSVSSSSASKTVAFRFSDTGTVGVETLKTWFAIRVR